MLGAPDFIDNPNVVLEKGEYIISPSANLSEQERKKLQKQILEYRKSYLNHLNRSIYMGHLKMDKNGDFYLSKKAPQAIKDYYNSLIHEEY